MQCENPTREYGTLQLSMVRKYRYERNLTLPEISFEVCTKIATLPTVFRRKRSDGGSFSRTDRAGFEASAHSSAPKPWLL